MSKRLLPTLVFLFIFASGYGQTAAPRELGAQISSFGSSPFSLIYKKQKTENRYHRWRAAIGQISVNNIESSSENLTLDLGLFYGLEKRRALAEQITFNHGWEFGGNLGLGFTENDPNFSLGLGLGYVLGVQYNARQPFFVNIETIPGIHVRFLNTAGSQDFAIVSNIGFNSLAALTVGLRF
jgi:hypothetical protein